MLNPNLYQRTISTTGRFLTSLPVSTSIIESPKISKRETFTIAFPQEKTNFNSISEPERPSYKTFLGLKFYRSNYSFQNYNVPNIQHNFNWNNFNQKIPKVEIIPSYYLNLPSAVFHQVTDTYRSKIVTNHIAEVIVNNHFSKKESAIIVFGHSEGGQSVIRGSEIQTLIDKVYVLLGGEFSGLQYSPILDQERFYYDPLDAQTYDEAEKLVYNFKKSDLYKIVTLGTPGNLSGGETLNATHYRNNQDYVTKFVYSYNYELIPGQGHGLYKNYFAQATKEINDFYEEHSDKDITIVAGLGIGGNRYKDYDLEKNIKKIFSSIQE